MSSEKIQILDQMSSDKTQILDPISTISRIILLHFSPPNTKLRILEHRVQIIEDNFMNKMARTINNKIWWYQENRCDICFFYPVFVRFIKLYLMEKQKNKESKIVYDYLKKIAEYSIIGLKEYQKTYGYDNATFVLQYYISLIKDGIDNKFSEDSLPEILRDVKKNNLPNNIKMQKIWEDAHIIELGKGFEACFNAELTNDAIILDSNKKK